MSVEDPFDLNGVLLSVLDRPNRRLRITEVDPASGVVFPKDENGVWSDAFNDDGTVRVVFV